MKIGWNVAFKIMKMCSMSIQSENVWNVVPEEEKVVGRHLRTSISASTRAKGVVAPFL